MTLQDPDLTARVAAEVVRLVGGSPGPKDLNAALRLLAKWRCRRLGAEMNRQGEVALRHGPFAGMVYPGAAAEGAVLPRRLGIYEASLAPVIAEIIARKPGVVVDIGAAEGYYAVGLARCLPEARVLARDGNPRALLMCGQLAAANGVAARVELGGEIGHPELDRLAQGGCTIICDIEGAEAALLDPDLAPGLRQADLLVEVHESMQPGTLDLLGRRFAASHLIRRIDRRLDDTALTGWMEALSDLDRLLLMWEWRTAPTPWLWMTRR